MKTPDKMKLLRARDKLAARLQNQPDVVMVDIGIDPNHKSTTPVLRVHRRTESQIADVPDMVDGFEVHQIFGEYRLD